jgi:HEAT repeat protein
MATRGGTGRRLAVTLALARGLSQQAAAAECGSSERTVSRWMAQPAFRQEVSRLRGDLIGAAVGRLAGAMTEAADTLYQLLKAESETVRRGAARDLLELGLRGRQVSELEDRLADLERLAAAQAEGGRV